MEYRWGRLRQVEWRQHHINMDKNLLEKLSDEHIKFLRSPTWALIKFRLLEYQKRQQDYIGNNLSRGELNVAYGLQREIDGITMVIKLTEGLGKEIQDKTLDVDVALRVIENK